MLFGTACKYLVLYVFYFNIQHFVKKFNKNTTYFQYTVFSLLCCYALLCYVNLTFVVK